MLWLNVITVLCFSPGLRGVSEIPPSRWLIGLLVLGPAGPVSGILALRHADASMLAPLNYVRHVFVQFLRQPGARAGLKTLEDFAIEKAARR